MPPQIIWKIMKPLRTAFTILFMLIYSFSAYAVDPNYNWKTLETENFRIHFRDGEENVGRDGRD